MQKLISVYEGCDISIMLLGFYVVNATVLLVSL